jgi:predicted NBD/HSP70 family sugar kinase
MPALLVDLGGTHLRLGMWHEGAEPRIIERRRIDGEARRDIWHEIITEITGFAAGAGRLLPAAAPLVISFPGPVVDRSRVVDAPTVAGTSSVLPDLHSIISKETRREVHLLNDISAAAWHISKRIAAKRFMVVTVSSGIGSKIFDRDHPRGVIDDVAYAGEIGHAKIDEKPDAPLCDCGGRGHVGAIASGRGILGFAKRAAGVDPGFRDSLCVTKFAATPNSLTNEDHLVPALQLGDKWAADIVRECTAALARVLLPAAIAAGVERIVVIGGFALSLGETYRAILQSEILSRCDYRVMSSSLKDLVVMGDEDACLLGTAAYASQFCSL